jgi:hypothetical protein
MVVRLGGSIPRVRIATLAVAFLLVACETPRDVEAPPAPEPEAAPATPATAPPPPPATPLPGDGRVLVDGAEYPWSAIGRVNTGGRGHCTGILVGEAQVLASAVCLYNATEGRWWSHGEVHFVAGYQRDSWQADSPLLHFEPAPQYDPAAGRSLANLVNNWAVLELTEPIGRRTGWLGLRRLDAATKSEIRGGAAQVLPVGYRRGRDHAITLNLGCGLDGPVQGSNCELLPFDSGLPPLVFAGGDFRALGEQLPDGGDLGAAGELGRALADAGLASTEGRAPGAGGKVSPVPLATIDQFLDYLGYGVPADAAARRAAIRDFQRRRGLPVDGRAGVALLGHLIWAAQPGPAVSQADPPGGRPVLASLRPAAGGF